MRSENANISVRFEESITAKLERNTIATVILPAMCHLTCLGLARLIVARMKPPANPEKNADLHEGK
jgi:hypothetical protein